MSERLLPKPNGIGRSQIDAARGLNTVSGRELRGAIEHLENQSSLTDDEAAGLFLTEQYKWLKRGYREDNAWLVVWMVITAFVSATIAIIYQGDYIFGDSLQPKPWADVSSILWIEGFIFALLLASRIWRGRHDPARPEWNGELLDEDQAISSERHQQMLLCFRRDHVASPVITEWLKSGNAVRVYQHQALMDYDRALRLAVAELPYLSTPTSTDPVSAAA